MPRYYTADDLGAPCRVCRVAMPKALLAAGEHVHATCSDDFDLVEAKRMREVELHYDV